MARLADTDRCAVLVVDLQNDFLHPDGAYARGGVRSDALSAVPQHVTPVLEAARLASVPVVFSQFTLVPGRDREPMISPHLAELRPFLAAGDFEPGSWGQRSLEVLGAPDATVEKVAYSAFAHTRLGWWLDKVGVDQLVVCGIVTNGGVASTVRDAHVRELEVTLLSDGCAAFDQELHEATLRSLGSVATVTASTELLERWSAS